MNVLFYILQAGKNNTVLQSTKNRNYLFGWIDLILFHFDSTSSLLLTIYLFEVIF